MKESTIQDIFYFSKVKGPASYESPENEDLQRILKAGRDSRTRIHEASPMPEEILMPDEREKLELVSLLPGAPGMKANLTLANDSEAQGHGLIAGFERTAAIPGIGIIASIAGKAAKALPAGVATFKDAYRRFLSLGINNDSVGSKEWMRKAAQLQEETGWIPHLTNNPEHIFHEIDTKTLHIDKASPKGYNFPAFAKAHPVEDSATSIVNASDYSYYKHSPNSAFPEQSKYTIGLKEGLSSIERRKDAAHEFAHSASAHSGLPEGDNKGNYLAQIKGINRDEVEKSLNNRLLKVSKTLLSLLPKVQKNIATKEEVLAYEKNLDEYDLYRQTKKVINEENKRAYGKYESEFGERVSRIAGESVDMSLEQKRLSPYWGRSDPNGLLPSSPGHANFGLKGKSPSSYPIKPPLEYTIPPGVAVKKLPSYTPPGVDKKNTPSWVKAMKRYGDSAWLNQSIKQGLKEEENLPARIKALRGGPLKKYPEILTDDITTGIPFTRRRNALSIASYIYTGKDNIAKVKKNSEKETVRLLTKHLLRKGYE